jgi:DNA-binding CsgD family transcriptional regulator
VGYRSSIIVGRDDELRTVGDAVAAARAGRGGAVFLVGESGIGKSRLTETAADLGFAADMRLLRGRGSTIGPTVPYRSLTEALLSLLRVGDPIDVSALGPYRPILGRLIPDWGAPPDEPDGGSLVILAEAVLRLTGLAGQGRGCLITLDDLQDADPETLAVVEYLIDNLDRQPTLLIGTIRADDCPALALARSASQRGTALLIELDRLKRPDVRLLAGACLDIGPAEVPDQAIELLWAGSAGNPFLVEELVTAMVDGGLLVADGSRWRMTGDSGTTLPATFLRSVSRRVDQLGPRAREVLSVAAVLGRRFPVAILRKVSGLEYRELLSHLHGELAAQLVTPDDQTPDWYAFHHSLIVEALLTLLTSAEHAALARRVADAVETVYPGLPGEWCQVCAALRLDAGDPNAAGLLFAEAGRRALTQGAAQSAVALLDQAWELLASDPAARADALEAQLYALAEAGMVDRALAAVQLLTSVGAGLDPTRRARLHTRLAWVAMVVGRPTDGLTQVAAARALLGADASPEDIAKVDVVAAHLELDLPGQDRLRRAEAMARRVVAVAEEVSLPVLACQAWQLLGALTRPRDPDEATACLEHSRTIAVRHNLPIWEIHALVRLGLDDALRDGTTDRLEQVRQQATRIGSVTARCQAEVNIALQLILRGDYESAETLIDQVLGATIRLKIDELIQFLLVERAVLAGHRGRRPDMERSLAELRRWERHETKHAPRVHGLARAFCALLEEDRPLAVDELAMALRAEDTNPTTFHLAGRYGLNLLLQTLSGHADWSTYEAVTATPASRLRWDRQFALFARAVLAGRSGRAAEASATVAEALAVGAPFAMGRHLGLRLVGEAALVDGWGTPVDWLRAAEEYFHGAEVPAVASACRALLRGAGIRVTQRRDGVADIPASLRTAGVTVREYEVLRLLVERLGNREIADRLHLSQRTVEKHVSSLIAKTGLPNRVALSKLATFAPVNGHQISLG